MSVPSQTLDIQLMYNQLTKTEKKIADYVLENRSKVLFMSITELAEACGVAEASVHRFCRTVGAKGYQEFKMKLSFDPQTDGEREEGAAAPASGQQAYEALLQTHLDALRQTNALLDPAQMEKIAERMMKARMIFFFGIGDSMLTAEEAAYKFMRITPKVRTLHDPHKQAVEASMLTKDDLIFFVSYSGASKDNVYVARIAKRAGAGIVVITRFLKSPLTSYADEVLICGSDEGPLEGGSMGAKLSQLHIIDVLFHTYFQKTEKQSRENYEKTAKAVVDKLF